MKKTLLLVFILAFFGCDNKPKKNAPTSSFSKYIQSFSGGSQSVGAPVVISFKDEIDTTISPEKIFTISPKITGSIDWREGNALYFVPNPALEQSKTYKVAVKLKPLFTDLSKELETFQFEFKTLKQNFEINTGEIRFSEDHGLNAASLSCNIQTADVAHLEVIKKTVSATQNGADLRLAWKTPKHNTFFEFDIEGIRTSKKSSRVIIEVNGTPLKIDKKETTSIVVPPTNTFEILSAKIISSNENYVSIIFSNPLDVKQNLNGFIKIGKKNYKGIIDGNELKVYLKENVTEDIRLRVFNRIRNTSGVSLGENYETVLPFTQTKPKVRFSINKDKTILPSVDTFIVPFEAIGLNAVDVSVVKVFTNNMLQYLQVNTLGQKQQLNRVARPVLKKTVDLSGLGVTNFHKWNTFSLNLSELIQLDPGALYQVNIGFRRKHALYQCDKDKDLIEDIPEENWGADTGESSYWDSYQGYYSSNYNWKERNNPCDDSYYGGRRSVRKLFLASDLGIIAKRSDFGDLSVFVSSLKEAFPLQGVEVGLYDYQQQRINTAYTDSEGFAKIKISEGKPFALIAKKDSQRGYLKLNDFSSLSLSNFDISGTKVRQGLKGFIYGERGVWRPSDSIHLTFVLQDHKKNLPKNHPVIMELYDPNNRLTYRKINTTPVGNMYSFDFVTNEDAPTGNWRAKARVGAAAFSKKIRVETVKPNRLKISLNPTKEKLTHQDQSFEGLLNVSWLTGAIAKNLKVEYDMMLQATKTVFKGFSSYVFDDKSRILLSQRNLVYKGKLNAQGDATIKFDLGNNQSVPGALNVLLFGKVYEEGGDFSISKTQVPYYPFASFVGLKAPDGDKRGMLLTDKKHKIQIATLDANGKPLSKKNIKVSLYKLKWKWWWDKSYENLGNYIGRSFKRPTHSFKTSTINGKGVCEIEVKNNDWGRYYVKIEDPASGHSAGQVLYFDWPGWAGKAKDGQLDGASMLDFSVQKETFNVDEEVSLTVPSTEGNRILVSLETGKNVLKTFWVVAESERTQIKFKTTKEMSPNVYVHLTMIQPHEQNKNDLPIRLYGIKNINVVDPETRLTPVIKLPKKLAPEESFKVKISEKEGKAMSYTLAMVDEGLLDLTNFKTPDIWKSFFNKEALSVKTWDLYNHVLGAFASENTFMTTIGGDAELTAKDEKTANRFKPVVKFLGPFYLKKGERKSHKITMPQYLGSVRTMVVAATDVAYGSAEETTPVKQDLMALATMPRVAGPNEQIKLPVNIFSLNDKIKDVTVNIEISGALKSVGKTSKKIKFNGAGDQMVYFDVKALTALGIGKVKVHAASGKTNATYEIEMNVIPRNPFISVLASAQAVTSKTPWEHQYVPLGIKGKNEAVVEVSTLPPLNLEERLNYLIRYPHGCVEQITSSVFPQLNLSALVSLSSERKERIQQNITGAIFKLGRFQTSEGGFGYWPGHQISSEWGSNYAGHFLLEAKKLGYAVPETLINSWIDYQTSMTNNWSLSRESSGIIQAYRLYTLSLANKPAISAMNRLKEEKRISDAAKWRLALAYATAGFEFQAKEIVQNLERKTITKANSSHYRKTFGSRLRDRAMVLETLIALSENEQAFDELTYIAQQLGTKQWMSTQTTAYTLLAIAKYLKANPIEEEINATLMIGNKKISLHNSNKYLQQIALTEPEKETPLSLVKSGDAAVYVRLIKKGIPLANKTDDSNSNLNFDIAYEDISGNSIDVTKLPKGTSFYARVTVSNPGRRGTYTEMALTQIFPSGWEIINTRLDGTDINDSAVTYKDIRDDRVMHYFDLKPKQKAEFTVLLNAAYEGAYYMPMTHVEAMYDNTIYGTKSGKWVQVTSEKN